MQDAVWDKENHSFLEWCKTSHSFRIGRTSGLGRDKQERILGAKQGVAHDIFLEFKQDERPMSMPPTLFNAASAMQLADEAVASGEAHEEAAEEQEQVPSQQQTEDLPGPGLVVEKPALEVVIPVTSMQDASGIALTPVPCTQPSTDETTGSSKSTEPIKRALDMDAALKAAGEIYLSQGTRLGGADSTSDEGSARKRGRPSNFDRAAAARAAAAEERRKEREAKAGQRQDFMSAFLAMQRDQQEREERRAEKEAEEKRRDREEAAKRDMQFMALLAALVNPVSASTFAAAASGTQQ
jgi:hypothetical protein